MGTPLFTLFSFSIIALVIGAVESSIPTTPSWVVACILCLSTLFPFLTSKLKGKTPIVWETIAVFLLLTVSSLTSIPAIQWLLIATCLLLHAQLFSSRPSFRFSASFLQLFFCIGLIAMEPFLQANDLQKQACGILLAFMLLIATAFLPASTIKETNEEGEAFFSFLSVLLALFYGCNLFIAITYAIGILVKEKIPQKLSLLSVLTVPLFALTPFASLPYGFFLALNKKPNKVCIFLACLLPLLPIHTYGMLAPIALLVALPTLWESKATQQHAKRTMQ